MYHNNRFDRASTIKFAIFMVGLVYFGLGFFPSAPIEGDSNGIANGAAMMAVHGIGPNDFSYRYHVQPGGYVLIAWLQNATGLSTLGAFSLLSAVSALLFIGASAALVGQLTGASWATSGIVLLLFQETSTGGYYANTTVIAAALLMVGLYCSMVPNRAYMALVAGVILGLSAWVRFDAVLAMPALPLLMRRSSWKNALRHSAWVVAVAALVATVAIYGSGSSFAAILGMASGHLDQPSRGTPDLGIPLIGGNDVKSHLSVFSALSLFMLTVGFVRLLSARKWYLLGICLLGVLPFYAIYLGRIDSPKYLYYLLPFFSIMIASGLTTLRQLPTWKQQSYLAVGVALFVVQYILGVQASFVTKPYIPPPFPTLATLLTLDRPIAALQELSFVVGAGTQISTNDGDRLSSGILFNPIAWNYNKRGRVADLAALAQHTEAAGHPLYIVTDQYEGRQLSLNFLLSEGYHCALQRDSDAQRFECVNGARIARLVAITPNASRSLERLASHIDAQDVSRLLFIAPAPWQQELLQQYLADSNSWAGNKISTFAYDLQSRP